MRYIIRTSYNDIFKNIAWLSLQPTGYISFGLNDQTFIAPRVKETRFVWNAYNRITTKYRILSNKNELLPVINPHFTFHPPAFFHLRTNKEEPIFEAIADVNLTLHQENIMPWLRITSMPVNNIKSTKTRNDHVNNEYININPLNVKNSIQIDVDFVKKSYNFKPHKSEKIINCTDFNLRIKYGISYPQLATLQWFLSN